MARNRKSLLCQRARRAPCPPEADYRHCMESAVAYFCVSTRQKQRSGSGSRRNAQPLPASPKLLRALAIIAEFVEAETGNDPDAAIHALNWQRPSSSPNSQMQHPDL